ncbi:MAG: hypothetical protein M3O67_03685, partial [Bacteroidota bacterium]|nr:hypothetical protein [Bacteroidota bacterium]
NDEIVTYKSFLSNNEIKWAAFSNYTFYKNYLFLNSKDIFLSSIAIDKRLINETQFSELLTLTKQRLIEKKY